MLRKFMLIALLGLMASVWIAADAQAAPQLPDIGDSVSIEQELEEKGGALFDVIIYAVVVIAFLGYAVAGGLLASAQAQRARSVALSVTAGLMFIGVIGSVVAMMIQ